MTAVETALPTFETWRRRLAAAEQGDGWLSACEEAGRFLVPSRELIGSLAALLGGLHADPVLEVCAGAGELAEALTSQGASIVATDARAPPESSVIRASAEEALARFRPAVVLGCFVPVDAGVDEAVMACRSVRHYVVLGARIGGLLGSAALWRSANWSAEPIPQVSRWMLTRHDAWLGTPERDILQHGEAWLFSRVSDRGN